jgi:protein-S-isoprenylcysteine O-methyltransferase Ste14
MSNPNHDRVAYVAPPGLQFFGCLGLAYGLDLMLPPGFLEGGWPQRGVLVGALFLAAFSLAAICFWHQRRHGTSVEPFEPTTALVQSGPYRLSRNPLYVAQLLGFAGFALLVGSVWMAAFLPLVFLVLHYGAVLPEERYLEAKFGDDYRRYRARVRRWL